MMRSHSPRNPLHVASFSSLPFELRENIVKHAACSDQSTARALLLVSHECQAIALAAMYNSVKITKPSALAELVRTVAARPELGLLINNLFVGPDELLPPTWWPLVYPDEGEESASPPLLRPSVEDQTKLPRCFASPPDCPSLDGNPFGPSGCHKAIIHAVVSAQNHLYVDFNLPRRAPDGKVIGSTSWTVGVMELQAVLDLLLLEMRRLEDEAERRFPPGRRGDGAQFIEYPSVVLTTTSSPRTASSSPITGGPTSSATGSGRLLFLHRSTLLDHLYRRGGNADRFDHPLIFARGGINVNVFTRRDRGRLSETLEEEVRSLYRNDDSAEVTFAPTVPGVHAQPSPPDPARYATATIDGNIALMRRLLALTPHLRGLFLTGFLQRTLCGDQAAPIPPSLRLLCFGPLGIHSDDSLSPRICEGQLAHLEQLRIRGSLLSPYKRACIEALPQLRKVHWDLQHSEDDDFIVVEHLRRQSRASSKNGENTQERKRSREAFENDGPAVEEGSTAKPGSNNSERSSLLVQLGLSADCDEGLRMDLSADKLHKWEKGEPFSEGAYRFQLWTSKQDKVAFEERLDLASEGVARAYQDINAEWEACIE